MLQRRSRGSRRLTMYLYFGLIQLAGSSSRILTTSRCPYSGGAVSSSDITAVRMFASALAMVNLSLPRKTTLKIRPIDVAALVSGDRKMTDPDWLCRFLCRFPESWRVRINSQQSCVFCLRTNSTVLPPPPFQTCAHRKNLWGLP